MEVVLHHIDDCPKLSDAIFAFDPTTFDRIGNDLSLRRKTVPRLITHYRPLISALIRSSASSIISRVMRSFSIFVFPYAKLRRRASRSSSENGR